MGQYAPLPLVIRSLVISLEHSIVILDVEVYTSLLLIVSHESIYNTQSRTSLISPSEPDHSHSHMQDSDPSSTVRSGKAPLRMPDLERQERPPQEPPYPFGRTLSYAVSAIIQISGVYHINHMVIEAVWNANWLFISFGAVNPNLVCVFHLTSLQHNISLHCFTIVALITFMVKLTKVTKLHKPQLISTIQIGEFDYLAAHLKSSIPCCSTTQATSTYCPYTSPLILIICGKKCSQRLI